MLIGSLGTPPDEIQGKNKYSELQGKEVTFTSIVQFLLLLFCEVCITWLEFAFSCAFELSLNVHVVMQYNCLWTECTIRAKMRI